MLFDDCEKTEKWTDLVDQMLCSEKYSDLLNSEDLHHNRQQLRQIGRLLDELEPTSRSGVICDWLVARGLCKTAPFRITSAAHVFLRELAMELDAAIDGIQERVYRLGPWNYGAGESGDLLADELYV